MPIPGPQTRAFNSPADELLYGGSAGSAKSMVLLGIAATNHSRSLILRRQLTEIDGLADELVKMLGHGRLQQERHASMSAAGPTAASARSSSEGSTAPTIGRHTPAALAIFLGGTRPASSSRCRSSRCWHGCAPPTWAALPRRVCLEPAARRRGAMADRMVCAVDRADVQPAGEGRRTALVHLPEIEDALGRWPGRVRGRRRNLHREDRARSSARGCRTTRFCRRDNVYLAQLQNRPEPLRSQLLHGDFLAGREDDAWQVIPSDWIQAARMRWTPTRPDMPMTTLGIDVAQGGADRTCLAPRYGAWFAPVKAVPGDETPDGIERGDARLRGDARRLHRRRRPRRRLGRGCLRAPQPPPARGRARRFHGDQPVAPHERQRGRALRQSAGRGVVAVPRGARPGDRRRHRAAARPRARRRTGDAAARARAARDTDRVEGADHQAPRPLARQGGRRGAGLVLRHQRAQERLQPMRLQTRQNVGYDSAKRRRR